MWYSVRPVELLAEDPNLYVDLVHVVEQAQLHFHPDDVPSEQFVLRADTEHPDWVYIHVGGYTPNAEERFTLRLIEGDIGNGGAGVKPRGQAAGYVQNLTQAQTDVMAHVLEYMAQKTDAMIAGLALPPAAPLGLLHFPMPLHWAQFDPMEQEFGFVPALPWGNMGVGQHNDEESEDSEDEENGEQDGEGPDEEGEEQINNHPQLGA